MNAVAPAAVTLKRNAAVATVQMNRPDALNALDARLATELLEALRGVATDETVRAVCLTGAGRAFCSGADLYEMDSAGTAEGRPDLRRILTERVNPITLTLRDMAKPVVAAVNGPCVGVGVGFALACDQVIAAESAYFLLPFVKLGLAPDGGASAFLPARVGAARASELAFSGGPLSAGDALSWGLINEMVPDAEFTAGVESSLARLASGPTRAYVAIKRQANAWLYPRLREQLALEADIQGELTQTADFKAGLDAFIAKTAPTFDGT